MFAIIPCLCFFWNYNHKYTVYLSDFSHCATICMLRCWKKYKCNYSNISIWICCSHRTMQFTRTEMHQSNTFSTHKRTFTQASTRNTITSVSHAHARTRTQRATRNSLICADCPSASHCILYACRRKMYVQKKAFAFFFKRRRPKSMNVIVRADV